MFKQTMKVKFLTGLILLAAMGGGYYYYEQSKVQVTEVLVGIGDGAKKGQTVVFDYRAFLYEKTAPKGLGKELDSTYSRHATMRAVLGAHQVIPGLDKALVGMKPGGQRQVLIASSMAYGKEGAGGGLIPPHATLVYQVELRSLE